MTFTILGVIFIVLCILSGKWKKWKEYYSTILYLFIADIVCDYLLCEKPLWAFNEYTEKYPILEIALTSLLYPSFVILFLEYYPEKLRRKISYLILWTSFFSILEFIAYKLGDFLYYDVWNIYYSIGFYVVMLSLIRLHYKRPLITWFISVCTAFLFIWLFKIPLLKN